MLENAVSMLYMWHVRMLAVNMNMSKYYIAALREKHTSTHDKFCF